MDVVMYPKITVKAQQKKIFSYKCCNVSRVSSALDGRGGREAGQPVDGPANCFPNALLCLCLFIVFLVSLSFQFLCLFFHSVCLFYCICLFIVFVFYCICLLFYCVCLSYYVCIFIVFVPPCFFPCWVFLAFWHCLCFCRQKLKVHTQEVLSSDVKVCDRFHSVE